MFSTSGILRLGRRREELAAQKPRATVWPSASKAHFPAQAEAEDKKLRKDPFGGPCFEGTVQNSLIGLRFRIRLSESSPVAGTIESFLLSKT